MKKKLLFLVAALALFVPSVMAAEVNDVESLKKCLTDGGACKVTKDIDASSEEKFVITKNVNLDLNGKTLQALLKISGKETVFTINSSVTGGKLIGKTGEGHAAVAVDAAKLVLNDGAILNETGYGVYCLNGATAIINGGEIKSLDSAISGNNTTGTMFFEVNGGKLTAERGASIYMPNQVSLKITDGVLTGGVSVRMGTITISGGTINAFNGTEANPIDKPEESYAIDGNVWFPDAIAVLGGTYISKAEEGNKLNLTITGGTINVNNKLGSAVAVYDFGKEKQEMKVSITGGKFTTASTSRNAYDVLNLKGLNVTNPKKGYGVISNTVSTLVTGGTFSTDVTEFVGYKYVVNKTGNTYTVVENKVLETTDEKVSFESDKALDNNLKLEVTEKTEDEIKKGTEKVTEAYKDNKKVKEVKLINLYEIDVLNGDGRIEKLEDGKFTIAIAIPESEQKYDAYKVIYIDEDGKIADTLDAKLEDGKVVFTTSHLSTYGVVGYNNVTETPTETKPEKNPTTSDINLALIISAIVISTIGVVITSKKISAKVTR